MRAVRPFWGLRLDGLPASALLSAARLHGELLCACGLGYSGDVALMGASRDGWCTMPDQPRECVACGRKVRISGDSAWFRTFPKAETFCRACWKKATRG